LIVYLGTGRLWYQGRYTSEAEDKKLDASVFSRLWGYQNCLTATSSYKQFESWYGWVFRGYRELQIGQLENQSKPQDQARWPTLPLPLSCAACHQHSYELADRLARPAMRQHGAATGDGTPTAWLYAARDAQ
jgi:hypothetical protein